MMVSVHGRVLDAQTQAPLRATLIITDANGRTVRVGTDRDGRFAAVGLEPGIVTVNLAPLAHYMAHGFRCEMPAGETGRFDFRAYPFNGVLQHVVAHPLPPLGSCALEPSTVPNYRI
jgi:hypothetical protein